MKRQIKIEDFNPRGKYRSKPASMLRLKGQWLARLGFQPGQRVQLAAIAPGTLTLTLCGGAM